MGIRAKNRVSRKFSALWFFALVWLVQVAAWGRGDYDEVFDGENVRPEYRAIFELYQSQTDEDKERFIHESLHAFKNDNKLHPLPRILLADEYDSVLKKGVEQRAKALQRFLQDHYSGRRRYIKVGLIPEDVVERVIRRTDESGYNGRIDPKDISFIYGPDIIRDELGQWRVIEDNPGYVGGLGDLELAYNFMMTRFAQLRDVVQARHPDQFYEKLIERYKKRAEANGGVAVLYMVPPYPDNEDLRIREIFARHGITTVTPYTKRQFMFQGDETYVLTADGKAKVKVGMVILDGEHWWLDPSHLTLKERIIKEAKAHLSNPLPLDFATRLHSALVTEPFDPEQLLKELKGSPYRNDLANDLYLVRNAHGLVDRMLSGKLKANYTPGIDFIGDKEFYVYVEDLIRFYLNEEPVLRNIPTQRFADADGNLDENLMAEVLSQFDNYVIKKTDGRGGDSVWVGPKVSREEIPAVVARIKAHPEDYIVQEYMPLSHLDDHIVDLRIFTDVAPGSVFVSPIAWGRGLPRSGNGKVNLSDSGREFTVLTVENIRDTASQKSCSDLLK